MVKTKKCKRCSGRKSRSEFSVNIQLKGGLASDCKRCVATKSRAWYEENKARSRESCRSWEKRNPEKVRAYKKAWLKRNPDKRKALARRNYYKYIGERRRYNRVYGRLKHGFTLEHIEALFCKQQGRCAICNLQFPNGKFSADHDHATNAPRGLLYILCNLGLGKFKDSIEFLQSAIHYLNSYRSVHGSYDSRSS